MLVESISALVGATQDALERMLGRSSVRGPIGTVQGDGFTTHQINVVCSFSGRLSGQVIFGMSLGTADRIASSLTGEQIVTFDATASEMIMALCKEILGRLTHAMSESGVCLELATPRMIRGTRMNMRCKGGTCIVIPFTVDEGELCATISLDEAA